MINKNNFSISTAEEFIATIAQHIPEKSFQLVRYVGWYSNRMRGDRAKQELSGQESGGNDETEVIDVSDYKPRKIPPPKWRECIKKIWEVDPLRCTHCQAEMKIISFINERPVIRKILDWSTWTCGKYSRNSHAHHRHEPDRNCRYGKGGYFRRIT